MKTKLSDKEVLQKSVEFFETVLEATSAQSANVKNNIEQLKGMLEMELMHQQLLSRIGEVLEVLLEINERLEQKEQNLTIH